MPEIEDITLEDIARVAIEKAREMGKDIDITAVSNTYNGEEKWRLLVLRLHNEEE